MSAGTPVLATAVADHLALRARLRPLEVAFWGAALASLALLPGKHLILAEIAVLGLFALSLDLILGYAGIISLGHAAFFGFGAYVAGLLAKHHLIDEPLIALLASGLAAAALGFATSFLVLRGSDLTRLMVTLGIAMLLREAANRFDGITGGADGLQGVVMGPVLGRFDFDLGARVASFYSVAVLFAVFVLMRQVVHSPLGMSVQALRDNRLRLAAMGHSVNARLAVVYTFAAGLAGAAGALLAQTTGFASLDVLDFHRSADVMLALVIGGAGWLWGGIVGAIAFKVMHDLLSAVTPQYWTFWLGLFLVVLVMVGRDRFFKPWTWFRRRGGSA